MKKITGFLILSLLAIFPRVSYGDMEDISQVKTPNVMLIFDTSNSMDNQPNGLAQAAGNMCIKNDGSGDYAKPGAGNSCPGGYTLRYMEAGGNHPNSKLYQAKKALKQIVETVVKDQVNLGFSTYAQFKTEARRGYYTRGFRPYTAPTNDTWKWTKVYWMYSNFRHGPWTKISLQKDSFTDAWGVLHTGVSVGTFFYISHTFDNSPANNGSNVPPPHPPGTYTGNLKITVTSIVYDAENNWYTFRYQDDTHDHYYETTKQLVYADSNPIDCDMKFPKNWGDGYKTYKSTDAVQQANPAKWGCQGPTKIPGVGGGHGAWTTQTTWSQFAATDCPATQGSDNFPANADQTTKWVLSPGTCYDWSTYSYPADGSSNKPHTWGYFKVSGGKWPNNSQTPNYYPSKDGLGNLNMTPGTYDNHAFFINFPDDKDVSFTETTRTTITNLVKSFLDLTPVQRPEGGAYWTKLPVHSTAGRMGITSNTTASNYTPLADSLASANTYFSDYINNYHGGDPSSKEKYGETLCRGNYIILLTDGLESCRLSGGNPDYAAAPLEAANLLAIDVKTFVIGFGLDLSGNATLNNIAASGGTTKAYFAANFDELTAALRTIFQVITGQYYGRSNPTITRSRDRLYRGNFDIRDGAWRGHLMAWDADKMTGVLAPDFVWDAGDKMNTSGRGAVYTWTGASPDPARIQFSTGQSSLYSYVNPFAEDINGDSNVNDTDATTVINFTLNPNHDDGVHGAGYYKGKRDANWKLGDIYHSTPVVIGEPAFFFTENQYTKFYDDTKNRETLIYVGTNDGMLHAFKNTDGREKFSIIPKNLLGKLRNLKVSHDYYVDSSPKAYDVYFKRHLKWQTILVTGERGGGPYFFAVNVNDPDDPKILWEWTDSSLGDTWGKVEIGRVKVGTETKYVAFLAGGLSMTDNKGNSFHIVDVEDGTVLKSFTGIGSVDNKIPSGATAFDSNNDSFIESVYFGDTKGTLWKIDVSSTNTADWTLSDFFTPTPSKRKPIYYPPAVVKNDLGKILVYFGTGNELNLLDAFSQNYFYEIEDQGATGKENWSKTLEPGEKVLASPAVSNWVVYFTSWVYKTSSEFCGAGEGRLWGLKVSSSSQTGGGEGLVTLDANTGKWKAPAEFMSLGAGIPSAPIVTNGMVYIGTSLNANRVIQVPVPPMAKAKIKSWREVTTK
jgi:hypothetical protein